MKRILMLAILIALATGCGTWSTSGNFTLRRGETLRGDLVVTSGEAILEENSRVTGSVFVTSGNLRMRSGAEVDGDVFLTSGNADLGPGTVVHGDIVATSGNVNRAEGARVDGRISTNGFDPSILGTFCIGPLVLIGVVIYLLFWLASQRRREREGQAAGPESGVIVGVVLIMLGAIFFARNLFDLNLENWWAWLILIPALGSLWAAWNSYRTNGLTAATRGPLVIGLMLSLVAIVFILELSWATVWPVFIIILGLGILIAR